MICRAKATLWCALDSFANGQIALLSGLAGDKQLPGRHTFV
jgi:hypothetical protein